MSDATWREDVRSWGRTLAARHRVSRPGDAEEAARVLPGDLALAHGCGRSYGDVALNPEGRLIDCRRLDRFIAFDPATGVLEAEAGVTLAEILAVICRPGSDGGGWFPPVLPGTRFVTLGGAIANDIHGKNHYRFGSFGRHVLGFDLVRSDGARLHCSPGENPDLFAATIGGLGLTGVVLRAKLQLRHVPGLALEAEDIRFDTLDDFFALTVEAKPDWEYTAAWVDCLARGPALGRGILSRARHAPGVAAGPPSRAPRFAIPAAPPLPLVNGASVRAFNALYWRRLGTRRQRRGIQDYGPVLFPLDAIGGWNRLYGPAGFHQFQCVVPPKVGRDSVAEMLRAIAAAGEGSMLVVLKEFGNLASPGMLSFPVPGVTLALDFPHRGDSTLRLLRRLEAITMEARGRIYPAKDSQMSPASFRQGYPRLPEFLPHLDRGLSSAFARRVGLLPVAT